MRNVAFKTEEIGDAPMTSLDTRKCELRRLLLLIQLASAVAERLRVDDIFIQLAYMQADLAARIAEDPHA
jgi:hypothetical protein